MDTKQLLALLEQARAAGIEKHSRSKVMNRKILKACTSGNKAYLVIFKSLNKDCLTVALSFNRPTSCSFEDHSTIEIQGDESSCGVWAIGALGRVSQFVTPVNIK